MVTRQKIVLLTLLSSVIFLFVGESWSLMVALSTKELTRDSEIVVVGEVRDVSSYWGEDGTTIFTKAKVMVDQVVKGIYHTEVDIEYEGGEVGGIGLKVSDGPSLEKGERVILFLKTKKVEKGVRVFSILGNAQGKYTIREDGIAIKGGFSVVRDTEDVIDNYIPAEDLLNKIRSVK